MRASIARSAVAASVVALVAACGDPKPIGIGVVFDGDGETGARFAAAEINASGGIGGRALTLRVVSAGPVVASAATALAAADSIASDQTLVGVVGHSNSSASLSGSRIYNARGIVQIAPTSSAPLLSEAGRYTFRLVASDVHQARFLAGVIASENPSPRTAVFYVNDDYGRSLFEALRAPLSEQHVPIVFEAPYSEDVPLPDVEGAARAIATSRARLLVWLGRATQLRQLLPALRTLVPDIQVLASDALDTGDTERNAGGLLTGVRFACFVDVHGARPELVALRERFRAKTGANLTAEIALSYDAAMLIATAARESGTRRSAIRDYLATLGTTRPPYRGATGDIAFDENGDPAPSYCLAEVTSQGVRVVRPSSAS